MPDSDIQDPFEHLKQQASERANRTVERLRAGITALQTAGRKITAESIKQITRDLEPGFSGLSFQVIRRNVRAYALYREAADAFTIPAASKQRRRRRRHRTSTSDSSPARSSYDPLQRREKRELVHRIRALEHELDAERQRRGALAYDQQAVLAKVLRLETELLLLNAERSHSDP